MIKVDGSRKIFRPVSLKIPSSITRFRILDDARCRHEPVMLLQSWRYVVRLPTGSKDHVCRWLFENSLVLHPLLNDLNVLKVWLELWSWCFRLFYQGMLGMRRWLLHKLASMHSRPWRRSEEAVDVPSSKGRDHFLAITRRWQLLMLHAGWLIEFKATMHVYCRFGCLPISCFNPSILSEPFLSPSRRNTICHLGV